MIRKYLQIINHRSKKIELGWSRMRDLKLLKKMHIVGQCCATRFPEEEQTIQWSKEKRTY
jgi:hypothetical protein